jgi:hypothetical protein
MCGRCAADVRSIARGRVAASADVRSIARGRVAASADVRSIAHGTEARARRPCVAI